MSDNMAEKIGQELKQWENELTELSAQAQQEVQETGKAIRRKYDERLHELQHKVEETREKLNDR